MVRPRADAGGGSGAAEHRARPDRPGALALHLCRRVEGKGRDEDQLAYLRLERDYHNLLLTERPNGDFAQTILRQLFFSVFMHAWWREAVKSKDETLAAIAAKAVKEAIYHVRHAAEWTIRLGDGTEESARRMDEAVSELYRFTGEMFETDASPTPSPKPASRRPGVAEGRMGRRSSPKSLPKRCLKCLIRRAGSRAAAARASMARRWASCSPTCNTCSAPIRG
jgi:hypothetical protein